MTALLNQSATRFSDSQAYYLEVNPTVINLGGATLSTINGDLTVNGQSYNPNTWSLYSTVSSTITFGLPTPGIQLEVQQGPPPAPPYLFFDNNQLAYVSQVGNVADWALFPAIQDVSIPNPFSLNADNANISTCTISSLTVDSINGGGSNTLNISSINAQLTLTSSFALTNGNISPNINLGLGPLFGNIGAWATGAMGVTVGSAALVTGAVGLMLPRQTNYITQGDVEMVNVTTQLQVSTLNAQTSSITRTLDITNQEIFTSTINTVPVQAIRSLSDPFQNASTGTASYLQAVSQWYPLPNFATVPALTDINVNTNNLLSTTSMTIYNGASIGGDLRVNSGPSYGGSWLAGLPGALQPQNPNTNGPSDIRLRQLMFNDGTGFANEVMLVNTTNSGRIGVNCGTPVVASALAYLSDGGGATAFTLYVAKNGVDTNPGTINAPYLTIGAAITARASISATTEVSIMVLSGTYTENITLTRNTFLVGVQTGEVRQPSNINGTIAMTDTLGGSITLSGLEIVGGITMTGVAGLVFCIFGCNIGVFGATPALTVNSGALFVTECRISAGSSSVILSATAITVRDCIITQSGVNPCIETSGGSTTIRQCVIISTSTSATPAALVRFTNTGNTINEISLCRIEYTSTTTDTGGNKCCIQFAGAGFATSQIYTNLLLCQGATTGTGGQIQCIQDTGAGGVNLTYGQLLAGATAHHIAPTVTKTQFITVP
jgi:hypothetical protein